MADDTGEGLPWESTFLETVIRARKSAGVSQTELAKRVAHYGLPFHQQTVQRIESGERPVRLNEAVAICGALGLELREAMTAKTPERALEVLRNSLRASRRDWQYDLAGLHEMAENIQGASDMLTVELADYVRAVEAASGEVDGGLVSQAGDLINQMEEVSTVVKAAVDKYAESVE